MARKISSLSSEDSDFTIPLNPIPGKVQSRSKEELAAPVRGPSISNQKSMLRSLEEDRRINRPRSVSTYSVKTNINAPNEPVPVTKRGMQLLQDNMLHKGLGFSKIERHKFGLLGFLPDAVFSLDQQLAKVRIRWNKLREADTDSVALWKELQSIRHRSYILYQRFIIDNIVEMSGIVYTPTIGAVCQDWHNLWMRPRELYFSVSDREEFINIVYNWPTDEVDLVVMTDGSRILGLGDLGVNGAGISLGKIELYVAGAGVHPRRVLPMCIDCGTNNESLLNDPFYFGLKRPRLSDEETQEVVADVMVALRTRFRSALIHFEDFATEKARSILETYRNDQFVFNDDIQGTGCVGLSAVLGALKVRKLDDSYLRQMNFVIVGAGSSAIGIVNQIRRKMVDIGMAEDETFQRFFVLDSKGMIGGPDAYPDQTKELFRRPDMPRGMSMVDVIKQVKPDVLIGCSAVGGLFSDEVLQTIGQVSEQPLILPLSNPTSQSECTAESAFLNTNGNCIFASGSPFANVQMPGGRIGQTNQCNNVYIFPGLGQGAISCGATRVTDKMLIASSHALTNTLTEAESQAGKIFPNVDDIRNVSANVAAGVAYAALQEGVAEGGPCQLTPDMSLSEIRKIIIRNMWNPVYETYIDRRSIAEE